MKVLIACEESGKLLDRLVAMGIDTYSCDLLPTRSIHKSRHFQCDVREVLKHHWDAIFAFPTCTDLCVSGAKHFAIKRADGRQDAAKKFFMLFADHPAKLKLIENPIGIMSTEFRKPDQIIQPWQYGHGETKATCLWLWGFPKLVPTKIVLGRVARIHKMPPDKKGQEGMRAKMRSETFDGIADAIADQLGRLLK